MTAKSLEERIAENQKKQEQLKEQEKIFTKRFNEEERLKRTRRLIEMGGIVEHVLERYNERMAMQNGNLSLFHQNLQ